MSQFIQQLTDDERALIQRVHQAVRNGVQIDTLLSIRNEIIHNSEKQFSLIQALDDILTVNKVSKPGSGDDVWACLTKATERYDAERAGTPSRKEWRKLKTQIRHTLFISMQWPPETLTKYGWNTEKFRREGLSYMYNCAMKWRDFEKDFIPQVNLVRWLKHCSALSTLSNKKEAKDHDFAPEGEEFAIKDLHSLSDVKYGTSVLIYGREVTMETAGQLQHEIRRWAENQDGVVPVGGKWLDLKEYRPEHWNIYLLKFKENGLLVRRKESDRVATPRRDGILSPPPSMRQTASVKPVSRDTAASDMGRSISGSVTGEGIGDSNNGSTAASVADMTAAIATCSATAQTQHNSDLHGNYDTPKTRHSDTDSTSSHGTGPSAVKDTPVASVETDLASGALRVRRSLRSRQTRVAQVFHEDGSDSCSEDHINDQGPSDKSLDNNTTQDRDFSSNSPLSDLSRAHDLVDETSILTDGTGKKHVGVQQESTQDPTQECDVPFHKTPMENEVIAHGTGDARALTSVLPGQTDESYVPEGDKVTPDLSEVESWLMGQHDPLFVGDSPTDGSHRRSEAPGASPPASRVSQEDDEALKDEALLINGAWSSENNRDKDTSADPDTFAFFPPAIREPPKTSLARTVLPQLMATQDIETKSSMTAKETSTDTTDLSSASESSSELAPRQHTNNSILARTMTRTSSERSSSGDSSSSSEPSLSNSDATEAWQGCNAKNLSSPFKFAKIGEHHPYGNFSIASGALAAMLPGKKATDYLSQKRSSIVAPDIPYASIEGRRAQEEWGTGYTSLFGGLCGPLNEDSECSDDNDDTSQGSTDPPHTHFGPRPQDCECDICDSIGPLLERIRIEASSNEASLSCRARGRWFGSARWASTAEVFDAGEDGQQSDCEVMYVDSSSFLEDLPLDKPVIIKAYQHAQGVYDVEALQKVLEDSYGNLTVTMTDVLADVPTRVGMEGFLTRFSNNEWSIGSSTPRGSFGTQPPNFLSYDRFRLLQSAVTRASCHPVETSGVGAGCDNVAHSLCVNGGLSFNRIESSGAFSGPHLGPLGGTWLHVLQGRRLCAFIPRERLTTSFRDGFVRNGLDWRPQNEQRLVLLEPDDVLILPADVVCTQLAVDAGVSFEGSFWDERDWGRYFTAAQWAAVNPNHVTAQIPRCATRLALHGLKIIAKGNPKRFDSDPLAYSFLESDRSGVFEEIVMAGRCSPARRSEECGTQDRNALGTAGNRRKPVAQRGDEPPGKRLCIR